MKLVKNFSYNNKCYNTNVSCSNSKSNSSDVQKYKAFQKNGPKGIVLHSIGCPQQNAMVLVRMQNSSSYGNCVHGYIDANDGTCYQTLPWNFRGWHVGAHPTKKLSFNNTHIGIEMCEPDCIKYTGGSTFTCSNIEKARKQATIAYNAAVELFAYLCEEFNLNPLEKNCIVSHSESYKLGYGSNHGDPEHLWNQLGLKYNMDKFRSDVNNAMHKEPEITEIDGQALVIYDGVNIRNKPDFDANPVYVAKYHEIFPFVGITKDGNFYKLTDGRYITTSIRYTQKTLKEELDMETYYNRISEMPEYARPTIAKLVDNKIINGTGTGLKDENNRPADLNINTTMIRMLVINDRAGIYDKLK